MADRNKKMVDVMNYMHELTNMMISANEAVDEQNAVYGKDSAYYIALGRWSGLNDALVLMEAYVNGTK